MIVIVNFSNRENGNCIAVANTIINNSIEKDIRLFNFNDLNIKPCGYCDYECFKENDICHINDDINLIYNSIIESQLTLFIIPNYCGYPCANYFLFNERGCGFFNKSQELLEKYSRIKKKFIVISNTGIDNINEALKYQISDIKPDLLLLNPKKFDKDSLSGDLMDDFNARKVVINFFEDNYAMEESSMAIVFYKNKILVTNEEVYGRMVLSLPKGHIERNETHIETAIRECFEETDVILTVDNLVKEITSFEYSFIDHNKTLVKKIIYPIVFRLSNKVIPLAKEERVKETMFMDINLFLQKCSYENVKEIFKEAIKMIS